MEDKLVGIYTWLLRTKKANPEYVYDNHAEFAALMTEYKALSGQISDTVVLIMSTLKTDIELSKEPKEVTRTTEEETFFRKIVGINTWVLETKQNEPNYIFDNVAEVDGLLNEYRNLNTLDPSIKTVMEMLTKDILLTLQSQAPEKAQEYVGKLTSLNLTQLGDASFSK